MEVRVTDRRVLDEAQAHIRDIDAAGELPLTVRRRLRESLVALLPGDGSALTFVAVLGLACAKRAWPVWRAAFPSEYQPMNLAETAVSRIREGGTSEAWNGRDLMKVKTYLDNKFLLGQEFFPAVYAGFASWAVSRDVLSWDHPKVTRGDTELEISPEEWDPCFLASLAIAGGAAWERIQNSDIRRREFWHWFLTTAVPEAFTAAVER
jgi:Immunity protein Imm5